MGLAAAGGLIVGILGTIGVSSSIAGVERSVAEASASAAADTRLSDAVQQCGRSSGVNLGDEDRTLTLDVRGKDDSSGVSYDRYFCILGKLSAPSKVISHIEQTTSMDGRQSESWDGITIEWSYHPDRGSDSVITLDD